ncbi:xaa-Arg dipeptidase isoform X1 [Parasteatoda tepidariorum]|uniref:xaa-Arg dipeptidase isoform X1 n=2 Tax=Parasteatoda tepidariorum TaxID=114398 RepID=UPI0039BC8F24
MKEKYKWVECNHLHFNDTVSNQHFNEIEFISIIMTEEDIKTISSVIDEEKEFFNSVSQNIWNSPELSFQETFAHNILTDALIKYGFSVQRNYLLQTAFRAEFTTGEGPRIAVLLEYDALPEIGHACGHNLIAEAGLAAAVGIKAAMEADSSIKGTIVALGSPAEESGGGKVKLIEYGAFEGIDAAMMVHPDNINWFQPILTCLLSLTVDYKGRESHASAFPWEGVNALDAAVTLYQNIGLLRQQMKPSSQIRAIITKGGTVPNIIPAESRLAIYIRAPVKKELLEIKSKLEKCIEGAAMSTGCAYTINYDKEDSCDDLVTNKTMCELFTKFAERFGLADNGMPEIVPVGSTDMGNVSYVVPSIHPHIGINTNSICHTKEFTTATGSPDAQLPTLSAAKAMAMTVLSLMRDRQKLDQAKAEFKDHMTDLS